MIIAIEIDTKIDKIIFENIYFSRFLNMNKKRKEKEKAINISPLGNRTKSNHNSYLNGSIF